MLTQEKVGREGRILMVLLVILAYSFALSVNSAGGDGDDISSGSDFTLDGDITTQEVILASSSITGSKHDFTFNSTLTPKGECSACHNIRIGEPFLWTRNLTEEEAYFNQTSNPNYVVSPTIYCYDCHDNHETVDNDPDCQFFINESLGRYIPQDVAFDGNMTGDTLTYDSSPSDNESGYYETIPPNTAPPIDGSSTAGHYIKSNPSGLTNINQGDKLPCTDCHEPHNSEPTNEVFLRGSAYFPLGGKTVSNLKASTKTRSGTGTGRAICVNCHGTSDTGQSVRFVDINPDYGSTERIVQTPSGVSAHASTANASCSPCHSHDAPVHGGGATGAGCEDCHGHDTGYGGFTGGAGTYFSHSTHTEDDSDDLKGPNINCSDCHDTTSYPNFADSATTLAATAVCDSCHSPNGSFDGVQMAKSSWDSGVYSGSVLISGKEKWCASCHDEEPSLSTQKLFEIIQGDPNATFVPDDGTWLFWSGTQEYGDYLRYKARGNGSGTATWTPDIPMTGLYSIYAWWDDCSWYSHPDARRSENVTYTINYNGGSEEVYVDQSMDGGQWNFLGTYTFDAGTSGSVVLDDDCAPATEPGDTTWVIADAIKFEYGNTSVSTSAPNIVGGYDAAWNHNYGFYETGHKIACTRCHDSSKAHIDHEHRTYAAALDNYLDGYRLGAYMNVPMGGGSTGISRKDEAALCFNCHDPYAILGENIQDYDRTNFVDLDGSYYRNLHFLHFGMGNRCDSDFDGTTDSGANCVNCHNVHGAKNSRMIRSGELMSDPGTTNKVPALDFTYYENLPVATARYPAPTGSYYVYGWWLEASSRHDAVKISIKYNGGTDTVYVNQQTSNRRVGAGKHTDNGASALADRDKNWATNELVGLRVLNMQNRGAAIPYCWGNISANNRKTVTAALTGNIETDWDLNDYYGILNISSAAVSPLSGIHTGGDNVATLTDSTKSWTVNELVGLTIFNAADGSWGTITANDATTVTAALANGNQDDWDTGEAYEIRKAGSHTSGSNAANLTDTTKSWTVNELVGLTIFNTADSSWGSITANDATTINATLSGGVENDWDTGDRYEIVDNVLYTGRHYTRDLEVLIDVSQSWTEDELLGLMVYNTVDKSYGVITGNDYNTVNVTLSGGVQNDWDENDDYYIPGIQWNTLGGPYTFGSDGYVEISSEGVENHKYVIADSIGFDADGSFGPEPNPDPEVVVESEDATLTEDDQWRTASVNGWKELGTHTGSNNAANLTDTNKSWTVNELVNLTINNLKDGSSGTITANTGNTINATLSGGSENDWDTGELYKIRQDEFEYLIGNINPYADLKGTTAGNMQYSGGATANHLCDDCHSSEYYARMPYLYPRVFMPEADPASVANNGVDETRLTVYISDPGESLSSVTIDLSSLSGSATQTMYDDGTHGDLTAGDKIYSYNTTVPGTVDTGLQRLNVIATNSYGSSTGEIELMVANNGWFVVDNLDADFVGYWGPGGGDCYGANAKYHATGNGSSTATFTPTISASGNYSVYAWWTEHSNRATDVPYTIYYDGGNETVSMSQEIRGGRWNYLGNYYFSSQAGYTEVIVDDTNAELVGDWTYATSSDGYDDGMYYHVNGSGTNTTKWSANLPQTGNYSVYAWWTENSNRATNAPYTINYSSGSDTIYANQEGGGTGWTYLGTYHFNAGTNNSVTLSDDANEYVIADAVKWQLVETEKQRVMLSDDADEYVIADAILFEPAGPSAHPYPIVDNWDATVVGQWGGSTWTGGGAFYGADYQYKYGSDGSNTVTWTTAIPEQSTYSVYTRWSAYTSNRAIDAPYTIYYEGGSDLVTVDQRYNGGKWMYLGSYPFNASTYSVVLSDNVSSSKQVIADAVWWEQGLIVDDPDASFAGTWTEATASDQFNTGYRYHAAGSGSNTATWTPTIPAAGTYSVYAWWSGGSDRATNAPFTIAYEGGSTTVNVSQQIKGGQWNYLGTYSYNASTYTVVLSDNADGIVVADAIRFVPGAYTPTSVWPISDNPDADYVGPWEVSTSGDQYYDTDFYYLKAVGGGTGVNTATWNLAVPAAGNYNVYARWSNNSDRAADAPYTINYAGGSAIVEICQQIRGGRWNYLGNYPFNASSHSVILTDNVTYLSTGNYIVSDAIKFESGSAPAHPYPIADNWNATFVGPWEGAFSTAGGALYGDDYQQKNGSDGSNTVTWTTDIPDQGTYSVYARWSEGVDRATNAPYIVYYEGGSDLVTVNQSENGGKWMYLGSYPFNASTYSIVLSDNVSSSKRVVADAVEWVRGLVLDDPDASFNGTWTATTADEQFATSYRYHAAGSGSNTATWTAVIPTAGNYSIYAWWVADTDRATNAPYTISYAGGSETINVSQQVNGGQWNYLGTYSFNADTYTVILTDNADGVVVADAIKFDPEAYMPASVWPISDNLDADVRGPWQPSNWAGGGDYYGTDFYYYSAAGGGTGANTVTWTLAVPEAGNYNVYTRWSNNSDRAADAPYTINYAGGSETVEVCQHIRGGRWNYLGNYPFNVGDYSVVLTDNVTSLVTGNYLTADAVKFESDSAPAYPYPIVDNWNATFVGPWEGAFSTAGGAFYGEDYQHKNGSDGSNTATWTTDIPRQSSYSVYARWTADSDRATNAPYTVHYRGGYNMVTVNQSTNGGKWMYLGSYPFNAGSYSVVLSDNVSSTKRVIADAVRYEKGLVVDDPDASFTGTWTEAVNITDQFNTGYRYHTAGNGSNTSTWTVTVPTADDYAVYAWWSADTDRATNASYTINYAGGSEIVNVSQQINGGQWNYLGVYSFNADNYTIVLTDQADGIVVADAIRLAPSAAIVDNPDAEFVGTWATTVGDTTYGSTFHWHLADGTGANTATWPFDVPEAGNYNVYAWWDEGSRIPNTNNRAADAPYTINYEGSAETVEVCQQIRGGRWNYLGTYPFNAGAYTLVLTDNATSAKSVSHTVIADAIMIEKESPPAKPYPIADNWDASFVGPWDGWWGVNESGPDFQYSNAQSGANTATWTIAVPTAGNYSVYAWWTSGSGRATNAPYTIYYEGGDETIRMSQKIKDGQWSYLGTYPFNASNYTVVLTDDANGLVVADAIKFNPGPHVPGVWNISDNPDADYVGPWGYYSSAGQYGSDWYALPRGDGSSSATWTFAVPSADNYSVYAWWVEGSNRALDAPYTITYEGGTETVRVNQKIKGGQWNYLGTYPFNASNYTIALTDNVTDTSEADYIIADAIKFVAGAPPEPHYPYPIADDLNATFVGLWDVSTWSDGGAPYNGSFMHIDQDPNATATWYLTVPEGETGNHNVYAWWSQHSNRPANAPYTITYEGGNETVEVCQQIRGGRWNYLGNYPFNNSTYSVVLTAEADGRVIADAIKFERGSTPANPYPIADNWNGTQNGPWAASDYTGGGDFYGSDFQYYTQSGNGSNTFTWTIGVPTAGDYNVYTRWSNHSNRAADAPYTINHSGGNTTVIVCQQIRGGQWNYLGNYPFNAGNYTVVLTDNTTLLPASGNYIIADAIKFESGSAPAHPYPIADNWNATFVGPWEGGFWTGGGAFYGEDYQHKYGSDGSNTVTWTTAIPEQSTYSVYTRWSASTSNRATNALYTIYYEGGSDLVTVDQRYNGGKWMYLGSYPFNAGSYSVVLSDNVPGYNVVIADAIKWENGLVLDDFDANFTGTWTKATDATDQFNTSYCYHAAGTGSNNATWTPNMTTAGNYSVYAWWSADTDRATNASYTVNYDGGSATIEKNQTQDGGTWNLLGIYPFAEGTSGSIVLSDAADGVVIADAVRFERLKNNSWLSPTAVHCSNLSNASALIDNNNLTGNAVDSGTEQYVVFDLGTNYTVPSIKLYTDGNSYTWNVSMGGDTTNPGCCNYSDWGTQVIEDWQTTSAGWTETELATPTTARYIKLTRSDGSGDLSADSLFEFMFDPPAATLTYELHSYADLHIYDPAGRHVGMNYDTGELENQIPGAVCSFGEVQAVSLPKLAAGEYKVILKGTGTGDYELVVTGESAGAKLISETFAGTITEDEIHDATTMVNTAEIANITITVDEPLEPTVQTVGVANVTLAGLYPAIDNVEVEKITLEAVNTTSMPEAVVDVHSVYIIDTTGSGNLVLRFDDVEHADKITAVYKIAQDGAWTLLPFSINGSTVKVSLEAGDPPVVFASAAYSLTVSPLGAALHVGETKQFTVTAKDPYGRPSADVSITWTSTTEDVGDATPAWNLTGVEGTASTTFTATEVGTTGVNAMNGSTERSARVRVLPASVNVMDEETQQVKTTVPPKVTFTEVSAMVEGITFTQDDGAVTVILYDANPTGVDPVSTGECDFELGHFSVDVDPSLNSTAYITFKVPLADLDAAGLDKNTDITLYQFSGGAWNGLSTAYVCDMDGMYARYNATASHFSEFVIGGILTTLPPTPTPTQTPTPTPTPPPAAGGGGPGGPLPAYLLPSPTPTALNEEGDTAPTKSKPNFNFMPPDVTSTPTATPSPTAPSTASRTTPSKRIPGFEGLFTIAGLCGLTYLLRRKG